MTRITIRKTKSGGMTIKATGLKSKSLADALNTVAAAANPVLPLFEPQVCPEYYHKMYAREWKAGNEDKILESCPKCGKRGMGGGDTDELASKAVRAF
jgi:hypothetical protein